MNARIEFNMSVIDMFDGCPSYLMYYSHKCPSCERPSWWNQWNVLVGGINQNNMVTFKVHMELMESEVRECRGYGTDWIIGTGERETIDQGLDGMEGKDLNEGIRTMALIEFMKLMEPTQLMGERYSWSWFSNEIVGTSLPNLCGRRGSWSWQDSWKSLW